MRGHLGRLWAACVGVLAFMTPSAAQYSSPDLQQTLLAAESADPLVIPRLLKVGDVPTVDPRSRRADPYELSAKARGCIHTASDYHRVNPLILEAIARHESRGNPLALVRNTNGSLDVGLTGINSVHFPELVRKGVAPQDLYDECVAIYVGAWKLSKKIARHGNTWWAIGAYHSETPRHNLNYQNKIYQQLVRMGAVAAVSVASN